MSNSVLMLNDEISEEKIFEKGDNYRVIIGGKKDMDVEVTDIIVNNDRELEILSLTLGENVIPVNYNEDVFSNKYLANNLYENSISEKFEWDYRNPKEALEIITRIYMPDYIKENLSANVDLIKKQYVHKANSNNVMISYPERVGNMLYYRGFNDSDEFINDHESDHLAGIKLFEAVRQTTLASFHVMGVPFGKTMVLTTVNIDYKKFIQLDKPYFIQVIPACKTDGGAMFNVFNVIQSGESCVTGYIGAYTFRTKEAYESKRFKK